ncbi:MAG TPA: hypothetical protein VK789_28710 [Bryobacteraceae bacterium]|nr:hypothetical protein [Bryobacteraceae bacterium]
MRTSAIPLTLLAAGTLLAQAVEPSSDIAQADNAIANLKEISKDLSETVRKFKTHLDEAVLKLDRGYRSDDGLRVSGADSDLTSPGEIAQTAVRKSVAFRMLASRNDRYHPAVLDDMDRIQNLIMEARKRAEDSTGILRKLLVVSSRDINPQRDKETRTRHDQLLKARAAAVETADGAWASLPVEAPELESDGQNGPPAWNLSMNGVSSPRPVANPRPPVSPAPAKDAIPIRIEHRRRITLLKEDFCRVALTDSGIEDAGGRRIFYEEEWIQRGDVVIRKRWRVAVDTATGEHILLKRYPLLEMPGFLRNLYGPIDRDHLWYIEPLEDAGAPSRDEMDQALRAVAESREAIDEAASGFRSTIRVLLAREDQKREAVNEILLDAGLPASLRESLFAIRADLGGVSVVLDAEAKVRKAIETAQQRVMELEPIAAQANSITDGSALGGMPAADWDRFFLRSDQAIDQVYAAGKEALQTLPPDLSQPQAQFPALARDVIVRMRRLPSIQPQDGTVRCLEEIWRMETTMPGSRQVRRTAILVSVDPKTGNQILTRGKTTYYRAAPDDALEEIFDEYAADDLLINDRS